MMAPYFWFSSTTRITRFATGLNGVIGAGIFERFNGPRQPLLRNNNSSNTVDLKNVFFKNVRLAGEHIALPFHELKISGQGLSPDRSCTRRSSVDRTEVVSRVVGLN